MIIMCAKCKKPARIEQRVVDYPEQVLVIIASCHGERQEMRLSRRELESTPGLHRQINYGTGLAFAKVAAA